MDLLNKVETSILSKIKQNGFDKLSRDIHIKIC